MAKNDRTERFFGLLDFVSGELERKGGNRLKDQISRMATLHRPEVADMELVNLNKEGKEKRVSWGKWFVYVLRLILTCPALLERQSGLEWVIEDFKQILLLRKLRWDFDNDFWEAVQVVRGKLRGGRPHRRDRDYLRHMLVHSKMRREGMSKTKAVEALCEFEGSDDIRGMWRSLHRVEGERKKFEKIRANPALYVADYDTRNENETGVSPKPLESEGPSRKNGRKARTKDVQTPKKLL